MSVGGKFVCLRCSKDLRGEVICDGPVCPRCTGRCEVKPERGEDTRAPLDKIATHAVMRMPFAPQIRKVETKEDSNAISTTPAT
jgi:DNA-directed RNA polymerase subunit RPC12/RpoP